MAAPARYPTSHAQLRALAEEARREGVPFEDFWDRAVRPDQPPVTYYKPECERPADCVVWPRDTTDRNLARAATEDAKEGWRRAYLNLPAPSSERALTILSPILDELERRGLESGSAVPSAA